MKSFIWLVIYTFIFSQFFGLVQASELSSPSLNTTVDGARVTLNWSSIDEASGYKIYYAPYPYSGEDSIQSFDNNQDNSFSIELPDGAAYYTAIKAYSGTLESQYSNIDQFIVDTNNSIYVQPESFKGFIFYTDEPEGLIYSIDVTDTKRIYVFGTLDENSIPKIVTSIAYTDSSEPENDVMVFVDDNNRVTKILKNGNLIATYSYSADSTEVIETAANGTQRTFTIDTSLSSQEWLDKLGNATDNNYADFFETFALEDSLVNAALKKSASKYDTTPYRMLKTGIAVIGVVASTATMVTVLPAAAASGTALAGAAASAAIAGHILSLFGLGTAMVRTGDIERKLDDAKDLEALEKLASIGIILELPNIGITAGYKGILILSESGTWLGLASGVMPFVMDIHRLSVDIKTPINGETITGSEVNVTTEVQLQANKGTIVTRVYYYLDDEFAGQDVLLIKEDIESHTLTKTLTDVTPGDHKLGVYVYLGNAYLYDEITFTAEPAPVAVKLDCASSAIKKELCTSTSLSFSILVEEAVVSEYRGNFDTTNEKTYRTFTGGDFSGKVLELGKNSINKYTLDPLVNDAGGSQLNITFNDDGTAITELEVKINSDALNSYTTRIRDSVIVSAASEKLLLRDDLNSSPLVYSIPDSEFCDFVKTFTYKRYIGVESDSYYGIDTLKSYDCDAGGSVQVIFSP